MEKQKTDKYKALQEGGWRELARRGKGSYKQGTGKKKHTEKQQGKVQRKGMGKRYNLRAQLAEGNAVSEWRRQHVGALLVAA